MESNKWQFCAGEVSSSPVAEAEVVSNGEEKQSSWEIALCLKTHFILPSFELHYIYLWQISRSGRIISEKEYRLNTMRKDHQRYVQECLARAIFHKVLDMEVCIFW